MKVFVTVFAAILTAAAVMLIGISDAQTTEKRDANPCTYIRGCHSAKLLAYSECRIGLRAIRMRGTCLVITMSIGRNSEANPISNIGRRTNWFGSMIRLT
jgi:hypothetical protein